MAILEVKNVDFRYGSGPWILKDISFSVEEGERVAILGPSGYGKSTLAKVIAGYLQPQGGEVLWEGKPLPSSGFCPIQLIYQHPEKALNPRWKMKDSLEEAGVPSGEVLTEEGQSEEAASEEATSEEITDSPAKFFLSVSQSEAGDI